MGKWGTAVGFGTPSALRRCGHRLYNCRFGTPCGVEGMWAAGGQLFVLARLRRRDDVDIVCTTGGCGGGVRGLGVGKGVGGGKISGCV